MRKPTVSGYWRQAIYLSLLIVGALWDVSSTARADEFTSSLKSEWRYLASTGGPFSCYNDEQSAADAQVAGTAGFCRWTGSWPDTSDPNGVYPVCDIPGVPAGSPGHHELRNYSYLLYPWQSCPADENGINLTRQFWFYCEDSANYDWAFYSPFTTIVCRLKTAPPVASPSKSAEGQPQCCVGNPIDVATGRKIQLETDYVGSGAFPLAFERTYYSGSWWNTYSRTVEVVPVDSSTSQIWVHRPDGRGVPYQMVSGVLQKDPDVVESLVQLFSGGVPSGWRFTDAANNVELYDVNGKLTSITTRSGLVQTAGYDGSGRLATVTDSHGRQLTFGYDGSSRLQTVTIPGGTSYQYAYDSASRLSTVTDPGTKVRTYLYNESSYTSGADLPKALTGILDENSNRFATFSYDASSRGIATEHAGGAGHTGIVYNADGTRTVTDALGTARTYSITIKNTLGKIAGITGPECPNCGVSRAYTYDTNGNVTKRTDFNDNVTCYAYDTTRNLETTRVEGFAPASVCPMSLSTYVPTGGTRERKITTTWHATFRLPTLITEANRTTGFTYDASGNALTKTVTDTSVMPNVARTWTYTYNSYGQVLTANGPRTDVTDTTTYAYYTCSTGYQCGQVQTITDANSRVTTFNTYNAHGQPLTITDPNGVVTTLVYDARQRLTSRQVGSETTTFDYWPTGLLKKVTLPDSSYLLYTYDNAHRLTRIDDAAGNYVVYTLDAMGNRTAENLYDPTSFLARTHSRVFNSLNQLWKDLTAAGTVAQTTVFGYDTNGNQTTINAPLTRNTTNAYDELNRLKQVTDPGTGITQFGYDANDNLTSVTDPRTKVTSYTYTGFGDLKTQVSPDTGTTTNTYDSGGNLKTSTDARSAITTYIYDVLNRVTSAAFKIGATTDQTITFTYDSGTNGIGRLTGASDANHSMSWGYDSLGRVTSKGQTLGTVTKSITYGYTSGNLTSMTTPSGQSVVYGYNSNHQVTSVSVNGTTVLSSVLYDPFGPVRGWTWGNSTLAVRSYDTDGKVTQIDSAGLKTYGYDDAFRITGITDTVTPANSYTYGYDTRDRLTSAVKTGTTRGWTYDANGNRLTQTGTGAATYTINSANNRVSSISGGLVRTYTYDTAGDVLTYSTVTATYNNRGRMKTLKVGTSTETIVYNALGERIKISGGGPGTVLYWYDEAGHLLGEYSSTGALVQETIWMGDVPVATLRPGTPALIYYVHTDHLNTPRRVTRPSDNKLMWTWYADPFGSDLPNENPASGGTFKYNLRFPGQLFDSHAGLIQNYFRDYDPAIGRYVESDPIGLFGGVNTYGFVGQSPLAASDSRGLLLDSAAEARAIAAAGTRTVAAIGGGGAAATGTAAACVLLCPVAAYYLYQINAPQVQDVLAALFGDEPSPDSNVVQFPRRDPEKAKPDNQCTNDGDNWCEVQQVNLQMRATRLQALKILPGFNSFQYASAANLLNREIQRHNTQCPKNQVALLKLS